MNNKKVLIITPHFAPESHAAVFRAHKLAKYLKRMGWNPYVITVDVNYMYSESDELLEELKGVPIHRTKYIEPSFRGLKMALGGEDRTYKTLKQKGYLSPIRTTPTTDSKNAKESLKSKMYHYVLQRYFKKPDRFWTWKSGVLKKATELIQRENISLVYTSSSPFTCNAIGIELKKTLNIKWIADFRDPLTYGKKFRSSEFKIYKHQLQIHNETFRYADRIIGTSSAYGLIFSDQYAGEFDDKFIFIPTGLDDDYLPPKTVEKENTLIFLGEYQKEYKGHFFELFKKATAQLTKDEIPKILVIGRKDINERVLKPYLLELGMEQTVTFLDHMPQTELYRYVERSKFVVLTNGEKAHWWNTFAKMIDYIALEKQVLAFVPEISEARKELTKSNTAIFLKYNDESVFLLKNVLQTGSIGKKVNRQYCKRYLASSQVKAFINVFEEIL